MNVPQQQSPFFDMMSFDIIIDAVAIIDEKHYFCKQMSFISTMSKQFPFLDQSKTALTTSRHFSLSKPRIRPLGAASMSRGGWVVAITWIQLTVISLQKLYKINEMQFYKTKHNTKQRRDLHVGNFL